MHHFTPRPNFGIREFANIDNHHAQWSAEVYEMARKKTGERQRITPDVLKGRIMLRIAEWAELTGTPLPTAYKYATSGKIPVVRIGSTLRIPVEAVLQQLNAATIA